MRRALALLIAGLAALLLQGGFASFLAPPWCPDLALLVVLALGLCWERVATGLLLAAGLGFGADLLSGSLVGEHALLRLFVFVGARLASRQLNLRGAAPLAVFAAGVSLAYGLALAGVASFFGVPTGIGWDWAVRSLEHALVNALAAPFVARAVEGVAAWSGEEESGRRPLRLEARRPTA